MSSALLSLLTVMILTRLLSKEEYGLYQQVWLLYNTALPFMMLGIPSGITYFVPEAEPERQKAILLEVALILSLSGLILAVGTYVFADKLGLYLGGKGLSELLRLFFLFPIFSFPLLVMDVFLLATNRAVSASLVTILSAVIQFGAVMAPVAMGYDLSTVVVLLGLSAVLRVVFFAPIIMGGYFGVPYKWEPGFTSKLLAYTVPLGLAFVFGTLILQMGRIIVANQFSPQEYASYDLGARELPFIKLITGSIMAVLTPEFVRCFHNKDTSELSRLWHAATRKTSLLLLPLAVFLGVFASDTVTILYSKKYSDSTVIFAIYILFVPLRITQYSSLLMAAGKTRAILWIHIAALPICLVSCILLMQLLGVAGVALGTVLTTYIVAASLLAMCSRLLSLPMRSILQWGFIGKVGFASVIGGAAAWFFTGVMDMAPGIVRLSVGSAIFGLFLVGCIYATEDLRTESSKILAGLSHIFVRT